MQISKRELKILFVGMPDMGSVCLDYLVKSNFRIVGVVPPSPLHGTYAQFLDLVMKLKLNPIVYEKSLGEEKFLENIKRTNPDIGVVCSYDKKFPPSLLGIPKNGFINCHPSLLPEYRGANPYFHIINNHETQTGITLHYMDEGFDTGDIIMQDVMNVEPDETLGTLFNKQNFKTAQMLKDVLLKMENGQTIYRVKQKEGSYKKAPNIPFETQINWNQKAFQIEANIRAVNPFFSCVSTFRGVFLKIISAEYKTKKHKFAPGLVVEAKKEFAISCLDGYIYPTCVQIGSYMICDSKTFLKKFKPQTGEKIG